MLAVYAMGLTLLQVLTGRPSVQWFDQGKNVLLLDHCEEGSDNVTAIIDTNIKCGLGFTCCCVVIGTWFAMH